MKAGLAIMLVLVAIVVGLVGAAEVYTRRSVDDRLTVEVARRLAAESEGGGFASVTADERGWTGPDLLRGRLSEVDVVAVDGDIRGVPVDRLTVTATDLRVASLSAASVQAAAVVDVTAALAAVSEQTGLAVADGSVTVLGPDSVQVATAIQARPATVDVRVAPDAAGGVSAQVLSLTVDGSPVDPALLAVREVSLLDAARLPADLGVDGVAVTDSPGGPRVTATMSCPSACSLTG